MSSTIDGSDDDEARDDLELGGNDEEEQQQQQQIRVGSVDFEQEQGREHVDDVDVDMDDDGLLSITSSREASGVDLPSTAGSEPGRDSRRTGRRAVGLGGGGGEDTESNPDDTPSVNVRMALFFFFSLPNSSYYLHLSFPILIV